MGKLSDDAGRLLAHVPSDGTIGGQTLQKLTKLDVGPYQTALDELIEAGKVAVGRGRGGSVRRIDDASDHQAFLSKLDAKPKSNPTVRASLKWEEERYWRIHGELRAQALIRVGPGRGGTVARVAAAEASEDPDQAPAVPTRMPAAPGAGADEGDWYRLLSYVLEKEWSPDQGFTECVVQLTARKGRKDTGGTWTRPDITAVSIQKFRLLPERYLEVWTFEVKRPGDWSVVGVHEASAHGRRATRPILLLISLTKEESELLEGDQQILAECKKEAVRLGVGLMVAYRPYGYENWEVHVSAERHDPSPDLLNGFLEAQLLPETQNQIETWLTRQVFVR